MKGILKKILLMTLAVVISFSVLPKAVSAAETRKCYTN